MLPIPTNIEKTNFDFGLDEYKRPNIDNERSDNLTLPDGTTMQERRSLNRVIAVARLCHCKGAGKHAELPSGNNSAK
jgi:hypothetical protein